MYGTLGARDDESDFERFGEISSHRPPFLSFVVPITRATVRRRTFITGAGGGGVAAAAAAAGTGPTGSTRAGGRIRVGFAGGRRCNGGITVG